MSRCTYINRGSRKRLRVPPDERERMVDIGRPSVAIYARTLQPRGGGPISLHALADTLVARGFSVLGLSRGVTGRVPTNMQLYSVTPRPTPTTRAFSRFSPKPDVILCNPGDVPLVHPVATRLDIPFVVYVQFWRGLVEIDSDVLQHLDSETLPVDAFDLPNIARIADAAAVVANSDYTAGVVERIIGRKCDAVVQPYLGDFRLNGHARKSHYVVLPSPQWGKGAKRFFALARRNPDVPFLLLAGDTSRNLDVITTAESISNVTVQRNWVEDMRPVFANALALFIATDTCETFCRAAAEARACGVPILALRAGNLPYIVRDDGGVCVPRNASDDDWQAAFEKVIIMTPEPTDEFLQDHRPRMVNVLNNVRRLSDVYMPLPRAPGIRAVVEHAARVLGVTVLPWGAPVKDFEAARLIVCQWRVPDRLLKLGKPTLLGWHSHCAQMDITRSELTGLADAWDLVAENPHLSIAFGNQAEARMWAHIHPGRSFYLPACLDCSEVTVPKTGGVFIPGPYGIRKNTPTALAACRLAGRDVHVTARFRDHPGLLRFAMALGCQLHVHDCPTVADVQAIAGACDVAVMLSMAETYCYGAAECVLAGTPVIGWEGLPATAAPEDRPWLVHDPTNAEEVASVIRADASRAWHKWQLADVRTVADRRSVAARHTLLEFTGEHHGY